MLSKQTDMKEIPRAQRYAHRPGLAKILQSETAMETRERNRRVYDAHVKYAYTLKEIADFLGIHYTTVSKAVKEVECKD